MRASRGSHTAAGGRGCATSSPRRARRTAPRREGLPARSESCGFVSFVRPADGGDGEAGGFEARADFTDVTADQNPDWMIDLNDEVIGTWRGESERRGDVTLVWGTPLVR